MDILDISEKPTEKPEDPKGLEATPEVKEERETLKAPAPKTQEDIARESGWKPADEWEGDTNTPNEFISAELFNERGKWIGKHKAQEKRMKDLESTFDDRLANVNKLHNQQLDIQKSELVRKRDDAIDLADRETANQIQEDIDKLQPIPDHVPEVHPDQSALDVWNTANPWIEGTTPKSAYAKSQYGLYSSQGYSVEQTLSAIEADIKREYPEINPGRNNEAIPEGGSPPGKKPSAKNIGWSELSPEELHCYNVMPGGWESKDQYLKAVKDSRSAAK